MSTLTAQWSPYFNNVAEAVDGAMEGENDILNLIGTTLDECEALMLLAQHAPDYERQDYATATLAEHMSRTLGHDAEMIQDVLRELSSMEARYRWSQHLTRLKESRGRLEEWKSCVEAYALEIERKAELKLEAALVDAGFLTDY